MCVSALPANFSGWTNGYIGTLDPDSNRGRDRFMIYDNNAVSAGGYDGPNCMLLAVDSKPGTTVESDDFLDFTSPEDVVFLRELVKARANLGQSSDAKRAQPAGDKNATIFNKGRYTCIFCPPGAVDQVEGLLARVPGHRRPEKSALMEAVHGFFSVRDFGLLLCFFSSLEVGQGSPIGITYTADNAEYLFFPALDNEVDGVHKGPIQLGTYVRRSHRIFLGAERIAYGNDFEWPKRGLPSASPALSKLLAPRMCYVEIQGLGVNGDFVWAIEEEGVNALDLLINE